MLEFFRGILAWIYYNPEAVINASLFVWAIANVVWAQLPRPRSKARLRVWRGLHSVFGLVATHSTAPGTFTWPSLARAIVSGVLKLPAPDPFEDADGDGVPDRPKES